MIARFFVSGQFIGESVVGKSGVEVGERIFQNGNEYTVATAERVGRLLYVELVHLFPFHVIVYNTSVGGNRVVRECAAKVIPEVGQFSFISGDERRVLDVIRMGFSQEHSNRTLVKVAVSAENR